MIILYQFFVIASLHKRNILLHWFIRRKGNNNQSYRKMLFYFVINKKRKITSNKLDVTTSLYFVVAHIRAYISCSLQNFTLRNKKIMSLARLAWNNTIVGRYALIPYNRICIRKNSSKNWSIFKEIFSSQVIFLLFSPATLIYFLFLSTPWQWVVQQSLTIALQTIISRSVESSAPDGIKENKTRGEK